MLIFVLQRSILLKMSLILYMTHYSMPSRAVLLTAEALNLKLELKNIDLGKQETLNPEFVKMNPQHTIPVLDDNGTIIWDSHAIMSYLVRKYGKNDELYPKDFVKRAVVDQRMYFESGVIFPIIRRIARGFKYDGKKSLTDEDINNIIEGYQFLDTFLNGRKWVAGNSVTIADFSLIPSITSLDTLVKIDEKQFPNIIRWIKHAEEWPFYHVHVPGMKLAKELFTSFLSKK